MEFFKEWQKLRRAVITAVVCSSNRNIGLFGVTTMIMLSNNTISAMAAANATIGALSLVDSSGAAQKANWGLTPGAADYFMISGNVLATARTSIPAGFYAIHVRANAQLVPLKEKARFVIQVS
jgi:predicted TIM-barrel enzyme